MTIAQEDIMRYLTTQLKGGFKTNLIRGDVVKMTDKHGQIVYLTCNIFGDILDDETREILAISDLPHNLDELSIFARPTKWKTNLSYLK